MPNNMEKGARALIDICTKVKAGEKVLIVTDPTKIRIAEAIAKVAIERSAETIIAIMEQRKRAGEEPPIRIAEMMLNSDVVIIPVSFSITHTYAVKNAVANRARVIVMTDFTEEMMVSGGLEADFEQLKPICKSVAGKFANGKKLKLSTKAGTNLEMDITGRRGNALYCMVDPGEFSTIPTVEANVSPLEGTTNGTMVVDASIPYLGIGILKNPIYVDVRDGFITDIRGEGEQVKILIENLSSQNDKNVYNIAELGVGLNPHCKMCGIMLEDEGVVNTCHIGIGTSITLGGTIKTSIHYDLLMWDPKIEVDGRLVLDGHKVMV